MSEFGQYLAGREIACEQAGTRNSYRCHVDDQDLSRVTPELQAAERRARAARVGLWSANKGESAGRN